MSIGCGEPMEARLLLTATSVVADDVSEETAEHSPTDHLIAVVNESAIDELFATDAQLSDADDLAAPVPLPDPPTIPAGLHGDMTTAGTTAVATAQTLHGEITALRTQKADCEEDVARLEREVADRQRDLDDAQKRQADAQSDFDQAQQQAAQTQQKQQDSESRLRDLQSQLAAARRARNEYARAISLAGRMSRQARRRGDHATAEGLGRQVGVNFRKYQEQVDRIRELKKQIRETRADIRQARRESRQANRALQTAQQRLIVAQAATQTAQAAYDDAVRRLNEAKAECERLCGQLTDKENDYLGDEGAHAAAVDAVADGQARRQQREQEEADAEQRRREQAEEDRLASHFEAHNEVVGQDLELPDNTEPGDLTPGDINRLLGEQGGSILPDDPDGEQLAQAAVMKALNAQSTMEAISTLGYTLFGMAWDQLTNLFPLLGAMSDLFDNVADFQQFVDNFRNGNLKVEENVFAPEWGLVKTTTIYNCNTGQYIVTSQVLFYYPSGSQHAGGAGRDGISVDPKHAGAYTVTYFGSVR